MSEASLTPAAEPNDDLRTRLGGRLHFDWRNYVAYLSFFLVFLFFAVLLRDRGFLDIENLLNVIRQSAVISVMAVGMVFVLSAGEIDLSIGSVAAMSAVCSAMALNSNGLFAGIAAGLGVGIIVGLVNGLLTTKLRIPSFVVTLGMMELLMGTARSWSNLVAIPAVDPNYVFIFGAEGAGPVSTIFVWMAVAVVLGHIGLRKTPFGRQVLATGGNRVAARFTGVRTERVRMATLLICSLCAAIAGMLYTGRLHGARYDLAATDNISVIAATVIGGTSLFGGKGTVVGAVVGSLLIAMLTNGLILLNISVSDQMTAEGVMIIAAVAVMSLAELRSNHGS